MLARTLSTLILTALAAFLLPGRGLAYQPERPYAETRPHDAALPHGVTVKIPEAGLDFIGEQLRYGLETSDLKDTIVEALEGQYFSIIMPIFGGNFRITIPCGRDNLNVGGRLDDTEYIPGETSRPWCPYVMYQEDEAAPAVGAGQVAIPVTGAVARGFRYEKVLTAIDTSPVDGLASPVANALFAALYLEEANGASAQLDLVPDHPILYVHFLIPELVFDGMAGGGDLESCYNRESQVLKLNILGTGCQSTFIATLEAELVTGGMLRPFFEDNVLFVDVRDFHTRLAQNLKILTPLTQNPALYAVFNLCDTAGLDCSAQRSQVSEAMSAVELALGSAALQFFERELNAALSDVLMDGINQLMFDKEKDGTPDPVVNFKSFAEELSDLTGHAFGFNFNAAYESNPSGIPEAFFLLDGGLYSEDISGCANPVLPPSFRYTSLEADGSAGHDPPQLGNLIPGRNVPYQIGMAISDDLLNQVVYSLWLAGMMCATISPHDPSLPPELAGLLTTTSFAPFVPWLAEMAPGAPVIVQVSPRQSPYVTFGDVGDGSFFRVSAPSLYVDVYVEMGHGLNVRPVRAFGFAVDVTAAVDLRGIDFNAAPLIDLSVKFDSANRVVFNELNPDANEKLAVLIPGVLDLMAPELATAIGNLELGAVTDCLGGLRQRDLVLTSSGTDPLTGVDNYLNLYLNFSGYLDFSQLITNCLFALAPPPAPAPVDLGLFAAGLDVSLSPAEAGLDPGRPYLWRLNGGFWSRAQTGAWTAAIPFDGLHRLDFRQDGRESTVRFTLDRAAPQIRTRVEGNRLTATAFDATPVALRFGDGEWIEAAEHAQTLRPGRHTLRVSARDAAGHEATVTVQAHVAEPDGGCASSAAPALLLLIALPLLRRLRRR